MEPADDVREQDGTVGNSDGEAYTHLADSCAYDPDACVITNALESEDRLGESEEADNCTMESKYHGPLEEAIYKIIGRMEAIDEQMSVMSNSLSSKNNDRKPFYRWSPSERFAALNDAIDLLERDGEWLRRIYNRGPKVSLNYHL